MAAVLVGVACEVAEPDGVTVSISRGDGEASFPVGSTPWVAALPAATELFWTSTDVEFFRIADGRLMPDGSAWIVDGGARTVLNFANTGELRSVHGREGEGPGEFRVPVSIVARLEEGVWVWDSGLDRLTAVSGDSSAPEVVYPNFPSVPRQTGSVLARVAPHVAGLEPGKSYTLVGPGIFEHPAAGEHGTAWTFLWRVPWEGGRPTLLAELPVLRFREADDHPLGLVPLEDTPRLSMASSHGVVAISRGEGYEVELYYGGGDDQDTYDPVTMVVDPTAMRGMLTPYRPEPWGPREGFDKLLSYGSEGVAAKLATGTDDEGEVWTFLCADGLLPFVLVLPGGMALLDALDAQLLVQVSDELDVERLEVWTLERGDHCSSDT